MTFLGASTDELRALAESYGSASGKLAELLSSARVRALHVTWVGQDADAFRADCSARIEDGLAVVDRIRELSRELAMQADEQDSTSSASGTGVSGNDLIDEFFGNSSGSSPDSGSDDSSHEDGSSSSDSPLPSFVDDFLKTFHSDQLNEKIGQLEKTLNENSNGKFLSRSLPLLGAAPDFIEAGISAKDGDTGSFIGNALEGTLSFVPHPAFQAISLGNELLDRAIPGDTSPIEAYGEFMGNSQATKFGESAGMALSEEIGLDEDGTGANIIKTAAGSLNFVAAHSNPVTSVIDTGTAIKNVLSR